MDQQDKHGISKALLMFVPHNETRAEVSGLDWVIFAIF